MDKSAERMADNTDAINRTAEKISDQTVVANKQIERLESHIEILKDAISAIRLAFDLLVVEFKNLNGNVEVLKEIQPLIDKFEEFLEEEEDKEIEEDPFDFGDIEEPVVGIDPFEKMRSLEVQVQTLDKSNPKEKLLIDEINRKMNETADFIEKSLNTRE